MPSKKISEVERGQLILTYASADFLLVLIFDSEKWRRYVPPKRQDPSQLHGVTNQKTTFSMTSSFRIPGSVPTVNHIPVNEALPFTLVLREIS
jgi:hypothetical protein